MSLRVAAGCNGFVSSIQDDTGAILDAAFFAANCNTPPFLAAIARIDSIMTYSLFDIYDIHLYDDVEQWDEYFANFTDTISKPVIVSEFGGPNLNYEPYTESYHAGRVFEYIKKIDSLQILEAYFFKLVEGAANPAHAKSGLLDSASLAEKEAYFIFGSFQDCAAGQTELFGDMNQFELYPNPNNGSFNIKGATSSGTRSEGVITDVMGRVVKTVEIEGNQTVKIEMNNRSKGVYLLKTTNDLGSELHRFVVE